MVEKLFKRKSIKITLIVLLTIAAAIVIYSFLHGHHTGIYFPEVTDHIPLPMRHWVVFSVAVSLCVVVLCLLMFNFWIGKGRLVTAVIMLAVLAGASFLFSANPISIAFLGENGENITVVNINGNNFVDLQLHFSESEHFHTDGIVVEITASEPNAKIFYTIDGSVPTIYSAEYSEPIYFELQPELYAVVLRAIAVYNDSANHKSISQPLTHTYFIGEGIHERFGEDILVFSLSINPDYLFDHDIGILVPGRLREEFERDRDPSDETPWWRQPANFIMAGRDWERQVHVETFSPCGKRVLTQAAGIRIHGGTSRHAYLRQRQNSLRLIARREYSPGVGRFQYDFFPTNIAFDGTPITQTDTLILRSGASDMGAIRNELGYSLSRKAGLVASPFRPVAIFLNGEYYGFSWLQVRVNEQYFEDATNAPTRDFDIISGTHDVTIGRADNPAFHNRNRNATEEAIDSINRIIDFSLKDLQDDAVFSELEAIIDIGDFLLYYAFHIFWNNCDWPSDDMRRWRYSGEQVCGLPYELDGRWRFRVNDMDVGLGFYSNSPGRLFHRILSPNGWNSPVLINILTRNDMADKFTMIMCDLAANIINKQTVSDGIDTIFNESVWSEVEYCVVRWTRRDIDDIIYQHQLIIDAATYRHEYIFESLSQYFGFPLDMFDVNISGGEAIIGTQRGTSSRYFNHLVVPVSPVLPEFYEFDHWVLNGERIFDADITVSLADANVGGG